MRRSTLRTPHWLERGALDAPWDRKRCRARSSRSPRVYCTRGMFQPDAITVSGRSRRRRSLEWRASLYGDQLDCMKGKQFDPGPGRLFFTSRPIVTVPISARWLRIWKMMAGNCDATSRALVSTTSSGHRPSGSGTEGSAARGRRIVLHFASEPRSNGFAFWLCVCAQPGPKHSSKIGAYALHPDDEVARASAARESLVVRRRSLERTPTDTGLRLVPVRSFRAVIDRRPSNLGAPARCQFP